MWDHGDLGSMPSLPLYESCLQEDCQLVDRPCYHAHRRRLLASGFCVTTLLAVVLLVLHCNHYLPATAVQSDDSGVPIATLRKIFKEASSLSPNASARRDRLVNFTGILESVPRTRWDLPLEEMITKLRALLQQEARDPERTPENTGDATDFPELPASRRLYNGPAATFVRVSKCTVDAALVALKVASAILNIEATTHVCHEPKHYEKPTEPIWVGMPGRRLASGTSNSSLRASGGGRRLILSTDTAAYTLRDHQQRQMACSANINGMISGLTAVGQFVSGSVSDCPEMIDAAAKKKAQCTLGIMVLLSGLTKTTAALSDVAQQCAYVRTTHASPYFRFPINKDRIGLTKLSCVVNVGQAVSYAARIGLKVTGSMFKNRTCEHGSKWFNVADCVAELGGELANIGQVATYVAGAVVTCGNEIIINAGCGNRVVASATGVADITEGAGKIMQFC
eukprot:TRINITY_DN74427_c0_g1_i1.p1 TRINITY_DN74427_c0_g1~~TRINITY_DN74427_c0_g1_i1.p1  ORF type:complete len:453 (-),score=65.84 TRINITY_DN74427_c0_g1_i1:577-1935(-)